MFFKTVSNVGRLLVIGAVSIFYIHYLFPQSWGFYTVKSNIPFYNIYAIQNGIADTKPLLKNNMSYGMGVSLKGITLYNQLYTIANDKSLSWKLLSEDSLNYITKQPSYISVLPNVDPTVRGKFLITKTNRPSYHNLKQGEGFHPTRQYILVQIK